VSTPKTRSLEVYQGDDFAKELRFARAFVEADITTGSDIIRSTGCLGRFETYYAGSVIRGYGVPNGTTLISAALTEAQMSAVATEDVPSVDVKRYQYAIAPFDLTGYTFLAQIRAQPRWASPPLLTFSMGLANAAVGEITMTANDTQTTVLPTNGWWDFQATLNGITTTWMRGPVISGREISRVP